jgi:hypothetical protein
LLNRLENGETLDKGTQQQAYLSQQGKRKVLGKRLEEAAITRRPTKTSKDPSAMKGPWPAQRHWKSL